MCQFQHINLWSAGQNQPLRQFRYGLMRLLLNRTVLNSPNLKCSKMAQTWRPTHHPSWTMCSSALILPTVYRGVSKPETMVRQHGVASREECSLQVRCQASLQQGTDRTEEGHPAGQEKVQTEHRESHPDDPGQTSVCLLGEPLHRGSSLTNTAHGPDSPGASQSLHQDAIYGCQFSLQWRDPRQADIENSTLAWLRLCASGSETLSTTGGGWELGTKHRPHRSWTQAHRRGVCSAQPFSPCSLMTPLPLTPQTWWGGHIYNDNQNCTFIVFYVL